MYPFLNLESNRLSNENLVIRHELALQKLLNHVHLGRDSLLSIQQNQK